MITEVFIKMCEKNKNLQKKWEPKQFDYYYSKDKKHVFILSESSFINTIEKYLEKFTWLPTQEQLQEMVKKRHIYYLIKDFQIFQVKHTVGLHIGNMNELWLAFVMYEEYNKIWTGKEWIKEK